jgi:membrane protein insertase Oxa1/YidC/SpoIIIJ
VGDPAQQKMMMWLMPGMMLFMFYSMPSALSLYWTFSQGVAIAQLWWQRRRSDAALTPGSGVPDDPEQGMTRQMRRRAGRE